MFSFTEGRKIARVKGGEHDKKYIYITNNLNVKDGVRDIQLTDGTLQPLPNRDVVEKIYVSAPSGAGKSTWCGNWIAEYKKMFKEAPIYVFSAIEKDKALDKHNPYRITLDQDLLNDPIKPQEIKNSLTVFDDIDTIRENRMRLSITDFRDYLLECGRHFDIRMLITSHLLSNYKSTRRVLNEATAVVVFPKSGSGTYHIKNFLKTYCGFDKKQVARFITLPSRWVAVYRGFPQYVMFDKGCYMPPLNED